MKQEFYIARRFAFKHRSATRPTFIVVIAIVGIAVGTAALILTLSIVNGFSAAIEGKLTGFHSHVQLRKSDGSLFNAYRGDIDRLEALEHVETAEPFIEYPLLLRSATTGGYTTMPGLLKGIRTDPGSGAFLRQHLVEGEWLDAHNSGDLRILVGRSLATSLGIGVGNRLLLLSRIGGDGMFRHSDDILDLLSGLDLKIATVQGIFQTGLTEGFDDYMVLAPLSAVQHKYLSGEDRLSGYELRVDTRACIDKVADDAARLFGQQFHTYTVYERFSNLFEWLRLQENITPVLIITITVVAVFNIISTLLVLFIEKTREVGMLMALGLKPGSIRGIFLSQGMFIAFFGILAGNLLALFLSLLELRYHFITLPEQSYFIQHVPIMLEPHYYMQVSLFVAVLTLGFAFVPARVASRLKPGRALLV